LNIVGYIKYTIGLKFNSKKFQLLQRVTAIDNEDGYTCCCDTQNLKSMDVIYGQNFV